ncbi:thiol:disulfide interchange protein tlpA [Thalassobacillus devorans]|uniref:Thiol:disulfide interchange protein tlpA n=1 Tax=Thalassobacillus devorans TaxID=279813 RepID=A0ABQ1P144_9BACI|nr:redoxin domain-containing protein [Thalassobacillus devorans]NIK28105.1 peroxiredoxin [Thalassobacillus devorans]GGC88821.1 thiol:disulfide interchange protein tlpA [Thalassobacillus devorans]
MIKRIVVSALFLILIGYAVYSFAADNGEDETNGPNEYDVSGDTSQEGSGMMPPNTPKGIQEGEQAPDFELETVEGETIRLSDLKGKKVFLNFWATWCPPCKEEMPEMQKFHEEFGEEVEIVAVNVTTTETGIDDVQKYLDQQGYTFQVPLDKRNQVSSEYQAITIPTTYFIGTDGIVQQPRQVGPMNYDFMVKMKDDLK